MSFSESSKVYGNDDPIMDLDGNIIETWQDGDMDDAEDIWSESEQSYTYDEEDEEDYCPSSSSSSSE